MLEGKTILITGAGSGIGRKTVELAFDYGANVVAVDLNDSVSDTVALLADKKTDRRLLWPILAMRRK